MSTTTVAPSVWYEVQVETVGPSCRYAGPDFAAAVHMLCTVDVESGEEGYVVATVNGSYSPRETNRVETAAMAVLAAAVGA